jgi:hypothetical protein
MRSQEPVTLEDSPDGAEDPEDVAVRVGLEDLAGPADAVVLPVEVAARGDAAVSCWAASAPGEM